MRREFNAPSQKSQHVFGEQSKLRSSPSWIQGLSKNSSFALGRLPNTTICKSNNVHELTSWRDEQCPGTRLSGHLGRLVSHRGLQPKKKTKRKENAGALRSPVWFWKTFVQHLSSLEDPSILQMMTMQFLTGRAPLSQSRSNRTGDFASWACLSPGGIQKPNFGSGELRMRAARIFLTSSGASE